MWLLVLLVCAAPFLARAVVLWDCARHTPLGELELDELAVLLRDRPELLDREG